MLLNILLCVFTFFFFYITYYNLCLDKIVWPNLDQYLLMQYVHFSMKFCILFLQILYYKYLLSCLFCLIKFDINIVQHSGYFLIIYKDKIQKLYKKVMSMIYRVIGVMTNYDCYKIMILFYSTNWEILFGSRDKNIINIKLLIRLWCKSTVLIMVIIKNNNIILYKVFVHE